MKSPIQSFFFVALMLVSCIQLSAQCSNINGPSAQGAPNTHVFGNDTFGQSIQGSCFSGNQITKFSFWSQGNSPTKVHLKIYEGNSQTVSGTVVHEQNDIPLPPANFGGKLTIDLDEPVFVNASKTYTFVVTIRSSGGGNLIAHVSSDKYSGGSLYLKKGGSGGFNAAYDLRFEVESTNAALVCTGTNTTIKVTKVTGQNIEITVVKGAGNFTIFPPDTGGTILEFDNVTHSLTRGNGVGPQGQASPQIWNVTRTDPSKPATIKYKSNSGPCSNMSLTLLQ
ncbi:MAG: hypothetical protein KTR30_04265 [Saprospiraceae bacterium]|nr:hypothetical protein [Saprospiraceae bacterium]